MKLFAIMSGFAVLQMIVFLIVGGVRKGFTFGILVQASFGNMGFAGMFCAKNEVQWTES